MIVLSCQRQVLVILSLCACVLCVCESLTESVCVKAIVLKTRRLLITSIWPASMQSNVLFTVGV
jgi:hypothetical protein